MGAEEPNVEISFTDEQARGAAGAYVWPSFLAKCFEVARLGVVLKVEVSPVKSGYWYRESYQKDMTWHAELPDVLKDQHGREQFGRKIIERGVK